jgi:hypothetical protein
VTDDYDPPDSPAWWAAEARRYAEIADDHARTARWWTFITVIVALMVFTMLIVAAV